MENEKLNVCSICLNNISKKPKNQYILPCSHVFHQECIEKWIKKTNHYGILLKETVKQGRMIVYGNDIPMNCPDCRAEYTITSIENNTYLFPILAKVWFKSDIPGCNTLVNYITQPSDLINYFKNNVRKSDGICIDFYDKIFNSIDSSIKEFNLCHTTNNNKTLVFPVLKSECVLQQQATIDEFLSCNVKK